MVEKCILLTSYLTTLCITHDTNFKIPSLSKYYKYTCQLHHHLLSPYLLNKRMEYTRKKYKKSRRLREGWASH